MCPRGAGRPLQLHRLRSRAPQLRNPEDVARKLRERVLAVTAVHIHRDRKKAAAIDTIDYMPQDSEVYRRWLHTQPLQRLWDRWAMMFIVGFVVGLCAFFLHSTFHTIASVKARLPRPHAAGCGGLALTRPFPLCTPSLPFPHTCRLTRCA